MLLPIKAINIVEITLIIFCCQVTSINLFKNDDTEKTTIAINSKKIPFKIRLISIFSSIYSNLVLMKKYNPTANPNRMNSPFTNGSVTLGKSKNNSANNISP